MNDKLLNMLPLFFGRIGSWWLDRMTLAEFCCNRNIEALDTIHIGMIDVSCETICQRCVAFDFPYTLHENGVIISIFTKSICVTLYRQERKRQYTGGIAPEWIRCTDEVATETRKKNPYLCASGMWRVPLSQTLPMEFNLPYCCGTMLDQTEPDWYQKINHSAVVWGINDCFFDEARTKNGIELLLQLYGCGKKAGIDHAMFIGYGTLLGAIRHGGFIPNDRDMDMCILADQISVEAAMAYVKECEAAGLGEHRWRTPEVRSDTGMPLWFSLGPKNPVSESGVKCCQWFWFKYGGYYWHSKGIQWISPAKFNPRKVPYTCADAAIAKGVPENCIDELVPYEFLGLPVLVPRRIGTCLDAWYPGWPIPREGASAHAFHLIIGNWNDARSWRVG